MNLRFSGDSVGAKEFFLNLNKGVGRMTGGPIRKAVGLCEILSSIAVGSFTRSGTAYADFGAEVSHGVARGLDQSALKRPAVPMLVRGF